MATNRGTNQFFDRPAVIAAIGRARARVLARGAAYVRTIARRSLRRRKGPAPAGQPPSVHATSTTATLKNIQFSWDAAAQRVICGPVGLDLYHTSPADLSTEPVPGQLEHGGTVRLLVAYDERRPEGYMPSTKAQLAAATTVKRQSARLRPRPFMAPALRVAGPKLAEFWKGQVTG